MTRNGTTRDSSLQGVDAALQRLNATIATYKIGTEPEDGAETLCDDNGDEEDLLLAYTQGRMFRSQMDLTSREFYPDVCKAKSIASL